MWDKNKSGVERLIMEIKDIILKDAIRSAIKAERDNILYRRALLLLGIMYAVLLGIVIWGIIHG